MQEKHTKTKETDITSVLVITFVILVAALIAKVAGDFTSTKTSTQTKAAPHSSAAQDSWCQRNAPLNGDFSRTYTPAYSGSGDKCQSVVVSCADLTSSDTTYTVDMTNNFLPAELKSSDACFGLLTNCCRKVSATAVLGDSLCKNPTANSSGSNDSYCIAGTTAKSTCTNTYGSAAGTDVKCAKSVEGITVKGKRTLEEGRCCNPPLKVSLTDCGRKHINCSKFNGTLKWDNDTLKNTNSRGDKVTTKCMANESMTDAFCTNEDAAVDINGSIRCDGSQFADKVHGQYGCFITTYGSMPSVATGPKFYCTFSEVTLGSGEKCKDKIHRY